MSRISGKVFAHFVLSFSSSYNDSAALDLEPKSVQDKWQRHRVVHAPHVSFARVWSWLNADILTALVDRVFSRSVGSYRCSVFWAGLNLKQCKMSCWSPWRLIQAIWSHLRPLFLLLISGQPKSQECKDLPPKHLSVQPSELVMWVSRVTKKRCLASIKKLWTKTPLRWIVRSSSGCGTLTTLHCLCCMMHQSHGCMGIVSCSGSLIAEENFHVQKVTPRQAKEQKRWLVIQPKFNWAKETVDIDQCKTKVLTQPSILLRFLLSANG